MTLRADPVPPAIDSPVLQAQMPPARALMTAEQATAARRPVAAFGFISGGFRPHGNYSDFNADGDREVSDE